MKNYTFSAKINPLQQFNLKFGLAIIIFLTGILSISAQTIRYVKSGGSGNGSSWINASGDFQGTINASSSGDEVWVAAGNFQLAQYQSYTMKEGVKIYGGFFGTETNLNQRDWTANRTILTGFHEAVFINNGNGLSPAATLDGFTLTDAWGAGAIRNVQSSPTIRNCTFDDNNAPTISNTQSSPVISNCIFINNILGNNSPTISNAYSNPVISNSVFIGNRSSDAIIKSVEGSPAINNCTFYNNQVTGQLGVITQNYGSAQVNNTIIWGNTTANGNTGIHIQGGGTINVNYTLAQNYNGAGTGNLNTDPFFLNINNLAGDDGIYGTEDDGLKLMSNSPAIDKGNPLTNTNGHPIQVGNTDITGNARIQRNAIDMGAYEGGICIGAAQSLYVDASVVSSGSGNCWDTAYKTVREALITATINSSIKNIYIAKGTYYTTGSQNGTDRNGTFLIPQRGGIEIYGGYPNGGGVRNVKANPTILSGDIGTPNNTSDNSYHVMVMTGTLPGAEPVVIDGLTITGGNANGPQFTYNGVLTNQNEGGGLLLRENINIGDKIIVRNCIITKNTSSGAAGGLYMWSSSALIHNTVISENSASNGGGVFIFDTHTPKIINSVINNNTATNGGGIFNFNGSTSLSIINSTIADNTASTDGDNIHNHSGATINVTNSIVWGSNAAKNILNQATLNATYSNILQPSGVYAGTGNINEDPMFENAPEDNYLPSSCSFVIDAGNDTNINNAPSGSGTLDILDNLRIYGDAVDMGAYESQTEGPTPPPVLVAPSPQTVCLGFESDEIVFTGGELCFVINENATQTITAPQGTVFSEVIYASFGNATGNCANGFVTGSCHSVNSVPVIENLALGNNSFTITASNAQFNGDPCPGVGKKLYLRIGYTSTAEISWTNDNPGIGLPASGTGNIPSFVAAQTGVANITFTGSYDECAASEPLTFTITSTGNSNLYVDANVVSSGDGKSWAAAFKTLQEALSAVNSQQCGVDSIMVAKGTYRTANGQPFTMREGVKILGGYPNGGGERNIETNVTILDGQNAASVIRNDNNGLTTAAVIDGFTITRGYAAGYGQNGYGGGIYNRFSSPTISNCVFIDNKTLLVGDGRGGSIYNYGSSPIITNCTFEGPVGAANGGAIYNEYASTVITDCTFTDTYAGYYGGAIYNIGGTHTINGSSFIGSKAHNGENIGSGGAIYNDGANITINGCNFSSNFTLEHGGAIYSTSSQLIINDTSFSENQSQSFGGAIYMASSSSLSAKNCFFEGNKTKYGGGAIHNSTGSLVLDGCIFIDNELNGQGSGGAIGTSGSNVSLKILNSLFKGNKAYTGGAINVPGGSQIVNSTLFGNNASFMGGGIYGSSSNIVNSIVYGNTASYYPQIAVGNSVSYCNVQGGFGGTGNIDVNPVFVNASDPDGADNVWGTEDDGFILSPCSNILNLGSNTAYTSAGGNLENDLDLAGNPRVSNETIDMGAYESLSEECMITWIGTPEDGYWSNGTGPGILNDAQVEGGLILTNDLQARNFIVVEGGSVTIADGGSLTLAGKITNQNEDDSSTTDVNEQASAFVVQSGGNLIQTIDYAANNNEGAITVERESQDIVRLDYTLWASPTADQQLLAFSPMTLPNRIYTYETNAGNQSTDGNYEIVPDATANFTSGRGYLFRAPNDWNETHNNQEAPYAGQFIGKPFNGNVYVPVYPNGYTSVGNPYPSNINPEEILNQNSGVTNLYFWNNPERIFDAGTGTWGYTGTRYISYSALGFSNPTYEGSSIAVGQGFIVYSTGNSVGFNNSMRVNSQESFFKINGNERHRIWLNLLDGNNHKYNEILTGYMTNATDGIDEQIDAPFFGYAGSALYNMIDEQKFTIQGLSLPFEASDIIPLGFQAEQTGKFTISLANYDGLFAEGEVKIFLKDKLLHVLHNLMESYYEFESVSGEFKDRFEIVFEEEEVMDTQDLNEELVRIYLHDQNIVIESKSDKILSVELFDLSGRNIYKNSKIDANIYRIKSPLLKSQVLIVKVQTQKGEITTKKIIYK